MIKQPTLRRLACFRDDVVFAVLLYQYWIYPTDKTRANEYGQSVEETKEPEPAKSDEKREEKKAQAVKETRKNR